MAYPSRPTLRSNENEFLLFIHPASKERAKVIRGYSWDPRRKCWVYPKTERVYKALVSEFGDELKIMDKVNIRSIPQNASSTNPLQSKIQALQKENEQLRETIEQLNNSDKNTAKKLQQYREENSKFKQEVTELREELLMVDEKLHKTKRELLQANTEIQTLELSANSKKTEVSLEKILKDLALESTGDDHKFKSLLKKINLDESLPLVIQSEAEKELRDYLAVPADDKSFDMFSLIQQAADYEALPKDAIDLAHTIRKQRNIVAHRDHYEKTYQARIILCLFAAALLWPEFPE